MDFIGLFRDFEGPKNLKIGNSCALLVITYAGRLGNSSLLGWI
jgi:hypothetical protein